MSLLVWPTCFFSDNHDNATNYLNRTRKKLSLPIRVILFDVMQLLSSLHFPSVYQPTDTKKKETQHKPHSLNACLPKQTFRFGLCRSSVLFFDILWSRHNWLGFGIDLIWTPVIRDFKGYWGWDSGLKVHMYTRDAGYWKINNHKDYGIEGKLGLGWQE